jgi:hypothetical protein
MRLQWDQREFDIGVEKGVYYPRSGTGVAWNGLNKVTENPQGEERTRHQDGRKQLVRRPVESFAGTIEAYTAPDIFFDDVFMQRRPKSFGFSYQVKTRDSYKIHLVYNAMLTPSNFTYEYEKVDIFSWEFETLPEKIPGGKNSAHLFIDPTMAYPSAVQQLEDILYGSEIETPRLPYPAEVFAIFEDNALVKVVDNGDGTFSVTGPAEAIQISGDTFQLSWPSVINIDEATYSVSSW